jgi:predicted membrane chloride channel (bestrophin family)
VLSIISIFVQLADEIENGTASERRRNNYVQEKIRERFRRTKETRTTEGNIIATNALQSTSEESTVSFDTPKMTQPHPRKRLQVPSAKPRDLTNLRSKHSISARICITMLLSGNVNKTFAFTNSLNRKATPRHTSRKFPTRIAESASLEYLDSLDGNDRSEASEKQKRADRRKSLPEKAAASLPLSDPKDHRYSASDWLHNIYSIPRSTILRDIKAPVLTIFFWGIFVSLVHKILKIYDAAHIMCVSPTPHSFLMSALGLLLVFRTNTAYQRFAEGRQIWERILSTSRNLTRLTSLYENDLGTERKLRMFRMLGAFPYLLHYHIVEDKRLDVRTKPKLQDRVPQFFSRGKSKPRNNPLSHVYESPSSSNPPVADEDTLPWCLFPPKAMKKCAKSENPPLWVCDRLSRDITDVAYNDNYTNRERASFLSHIDKLSQCVGECERIHQTAVPQNYARHSLRSLAIWLLTLPFALVKDLGLLTGPVMGVTAWLMFGVYQIGASIEDPFRGSLRLRMLCDAIYRDVMYETSMKNRRETAFDMQDEIEEWRAMKDLTREISEAPTGSNASLTEDSNEMATMNDLTREIPDSEVPTNVSSIPSSTKDPKEMRPYTD